MVMALGFVEAWVDLVMDCTKSLSWSFLNGLPLKTFNSPHFVALD